MFHVLNFILFTDFGRKMRKQMIFMFVTVAAHVRERRGMGKIGTA